MRAAPVVSIVLPTYDRLPYLREAVASVFAQSFTDWELLLVDDGSTDGTVEWARGLGDPRVRVTALPHSGALSALRNHGIRKAAGRYVAFLDSDDAWHPAKLERQLAAMRDAGARWSYTGYTAIDAVGQGIPAESLPPWRPLGGWILEPLLRLDASVAVPAVVVETDLLREVGGFSEGERFSEHYDLWWRLAERAEYLALAEPLAIIRLHRSTTWRDPAVEESWLRIYARFARGNPRWRRVCAEQRAFFAAKLARRRRGRGERGAALRAALLALRLRPRREAGWTELFRALRGDRGAPGDPVAPPYAASE